MLFSKKSQKSIGTRLTEKNISFSSALTVIRTKWKHLQKKKIFYFMVLMVKGWLYVTDWSLIFKKECFEHEKEVRLIVDIAKNTPIEIKYRNNYGYVIPFIEMNF